MSEVYTPKNYKSLLTLYETQSAIGFLNRTFEDKLKTSLNLKRVSAPLIVRPESGLNDDLTGIERPVSFDTLEDGRQVQIVHSLAKWKRMALNDYGFPIGEGIYTDMNAIRRDEILDNIHSIYVDQWDWELVIKQDQRNLTYLKDIVIKIMDTISVTHDEVKRLLPKLNHEIKKEVTFITTQELEDLYPNLDNEAREDAIAKKYKTVFIMQIGDILKSGNRHGSRAPDYDDWILNGDLIFWNDILQKSFEISSMGIRVDAQSLDEQLQKSNCNERRKFTFHKLLLENKLPLTIGGGIGQSRLCMLMLEKAHIGEVQVSVWDKQTTETCAKSGIILL